MRKLFLLVGFFLFTHSLLVLNILYFMYLTNRHDAGLHTVLSSRIHTGVTYAALPNRENVLAASIDAHDGRIENVAKFFRTYHSVLANYADDIVNAADQYNIDYRLVPAIAMQESTGCAVTPPGSNNCWGFGVYGGRAHVFDSYPEAINTVTKTLAEQYVHKGLETPEQIMPKWDPASPGSWAFGVRFFMEKF